MRFSAEVAGRQVPIEVRRRGEGQYDVTLGERKLTLDARPSGTHALSLILDGTSHDAALERTPAGFRVQVAGVGVDVLLREASSVAMGPAGASGPSHLRSPMPGRIVRVLATAGAQVAAGDGLIIVEAMKMENELRAARGGTVRTVHVREGQAVDGGALLVELE